MNDMVPNKNRGLVIDTSVIIKWFLKEEDSEKALTYLQSYKEGLSSIVIPQLLFYELGNAFISRKVTSNHADKAIEALKRLNLEVVNIEFLFFKKIFRNAQRLSLTFYDSAYVALAQERGCSFITADKKLYQKVSKKIPQIKLL